MNKEQYLLTCLAEECIEVAQRCTKALRFGLDEVQTGQQHNNAIRLGLELVDLFSIFELLKPYLEKYDCDTKAELFDEYLKEKKERIKKYMEKSINLGILSKENILC